MSCSLTSVLDWVFVSTHSDCVCFHASMIVLLIPVSLLDDVVNSAFGYTLMKRPVVIFTCLVSVLVKIVRGWSSLLRSGC